MESNEPVHATTHEEVGPLRTRAQKLEHSEQERMHVESILDEWIHLAALTHDISLALIQNNSLADSLQQCAQAFVTHLGAAFARIWTLNPETNILELQASAGIYTHLDGPHSRVPVGRLKIGLIASECAPHLTNTVIGDPRVSDQSWAEREGMVSFAGYPLLIEQEVVGVVALFARQPLSNAILDIMKSVSNSIALGIERKRVDEERAQLLHTEQQAREETEATRIRLISILDKLPDGFMIFDESWHYTYINEHATPYTGKPWQELLGKNVWEEFPGLVEDSPYYQHYHEAVKQQKPVEFELYSDALSGWFEIHAYPIPGGLAVYFRDITTRKKAEEERDRLLEVERLTRTEAEHARAEAETALQIRNDFLSNVSHDLKTPLSSMRGIVQLLQRQLKRDNQIEPTLLAERLKLIESSTTKMAGMVDDLLDVAHLQAGQELELHLRLIPLIPFVQKVASEQQLNTQQHTIVVETPEEEIQIEGDPVRLERVLTNLLANAIKYSPTGGTISVELACEKEQDQPWITLTIRDQGIGIPTSDLQHIFEPFYRARNVSGHFQGTGVGLASAAQVITHQGGTISVSSEEGHGSSFVIRLPIVNADSKQPA